MPSCVTQCSPGSIAIQQQCVVPEQSGAESIKLGLALWHHCQPSSTCGWTADHQTVAEGTKLRLAQFFKVPMQELTGAHLTFNGSHALAWIYISHEGEPGYDMSSQRLLSAQHMGIDVIFAFRLDTKRLIQNQTNIKLVLQGNASSVSSFMDLPITVFNATLSSGLPQRGAGASSPEYKLIYKRNGQISMFSLGRATNVVPQSSTSTSSVFVLTTTSSSSADPVFLPSITSNSSQSKSSKDEGLDFFCCNLCTSWRCCNPRGFAIGVYIVSPQDVP